MLTTCPLCNLRRYNSERILAADDDGSLTIAIQREQPEDATKWANWQPASERHFYLIMRIYWPKKEALDGTWTPPPVRKF